jgi:membrane protein implicated in regulation of membrane protease activity
MQFHLQPIFSFLKAPLKHPVSTKRSPLSSNFNNLQGQAVVEQAIRPHRPGRVKFGGTWWYALSEQDVDIAPGEVVDIVGLRNITLIVKPASVLSASNC